MNEIARRFAGRLGGVLKGRVLGGCLPGLCVGLFKYLKTAKGVCISSWVFLDRH